MYHLLPYLLSAAANQTQRHDVLGLNALRCLNKAGHAAVAHSLPTQHTFDLRFDLRHAEMFRSNGDCCCDQQGVVPFYTQTPLPLPKVNFKISPSEFADPDFMKHLPITPGAAGQVKLLITTTNLSEVRQLVSNLELLRAYKPNIFKITLPFSEATLSSLDPVAEQLLALDIPLSFECTHFTELVYSGLFIQEGGAPTSCPSNNALENKTRPAALLVREFIHTPQVTLEPGLNGNEVLKLQHKLESLPNLRIFYSPFLHIGESASLTIPAHIQSFSLQGVVGSLSFADNTQLTQLRLIQANNLHIPASVVDCNISGKIINPPTFAPNSTCKTLHIGKLGDLWTPTSTLFVPASVTTLTIGESTHNVQFEAGSTCKKITLGQHLRPINITIPESVEEIILNAPMLPGSTMISTPNKNHKRVITRNYPTTRPGFRSDADSWDM